MSKILKLAPFILIILLSSFLRLQNLGYSEFQDDEKKAFIRKSSETSTVKFLLNQRKGPMQFFVTSATMLAHNDPRNELIVRLPFTVMNIFSTVVFYLILRKLIKSDLACFLGSVLFLSNGFIVGFSRIAQYQNLNILFSLLSLLFFIKLNEDHSKAVRYSILGTILFCLSLLSHWDAVFYLVPVIFFYIKFLLSKDITKFQKIRVTLVNFALGSTILLPFLIPYVSNVFINSANSVYFQKRVGLSSYPIERHRFIFELYNPFVTAYLLVFLGSLSLLKIRKNFIYVLWFFVNFGLIVFFMQKPGTHLYNYVIPLIFLSSLGIYNLQRFKKAFGYVILPVLLILIGFIYYQSYMLFVDNKTEYPWDGKVLVNTKFLRLEKPVYRDHEILTFGFPHFRNWKKVADIVLNDPKGCGYITNEEKSISQIYLPNGYGIPYNRKCYYVVDIRRPFVTAGKLMVYSETVGKEPVYIYKRDGNKLTRLYKIEKE